MTPPGGRSGCVRPWLAGWRGAATAGSAGSGPTDTSLEARGSFSGGGSTDAGRSRRAALCLGKEETQPGQFIAAEVRPLDCSGKVQQEQRQLGGARPKQTAAAIEEE